MGLDAYVYRNRVNLAFDPSTPGVSIDDETGVVNFDDSELYRRFADHVVALHYRLGNTTLISQLMDEISGNVSSHVPIIKERVLGSCAHVGDCVELSRLDALERELDLVVAETVGSRSDYLDEFLAEMRELVQTAKTENNPIYFG